MLGWIGAHRRSGEGDYLRHRRAGDGHRRPVGRQQQRESRRRHPQQSGTVPFHRCQQVFIPFQSGSEEKSFVLNTKYYIASKLYMKLNSFIQIYY